MSDQFLAEIRIFPFNFAPIGWATCSGQILSIAQNAALFSLLGTNYGGNGRQTFGLPNLGGIVPMNMGNGTGLTPRVVGETGGEATVTVIQSELPSHNHTIRCDTSGGNDYGPGGDYPSPDAGGDTEYATSSNAQMSAASLAATGGSQPHNNLQPYLVFTFCIAMTGIFPPRS
jgi:microcystin-dependent protein